MPHEQLHTSITEAERPALSTTQLYLQLGVLSLNLSLIGMAMSTEAISFSNPRKRWRKGADDKIAKKGRIIGVKPSDMYSKDGRYLIENVLPEKGIILTIEVDESAPG